MSQCVDVAGSQGLTTEVDITHGRWKKEICENRLELKYPCSLISIGTVVCTYQQFSAGGDFAP